MSETLRPASPAPTGLPADVEEIFAAREDLERRRARYNVWLCYPALAFAAVALAVVLFRLARHHDWTSVMLVISALALALVGLFAGPVFRRRTSASDSQAAT